MTIDEAIQHCLETAEQLEERANAPYKCEDSELQDNACRECAADHRQLAEWLTELKELEAKHWDECRQIAHYDDEIKRLEAADVQTVKHGRWENPVSVGNGFMFCSVCRNEAYWDTDYGQQLFDYCPYCGAKMIKDGEQND